MKHKRARRNKPGQADPVSVCEVCGKPYKLSQAVRLPDGRMVAGAYVKDCKCAEPQPPPPPDDGYPF